MRKQVRFIINPISGTRGKEAIVHLIPEYLDSERFEYDMVYTERSGHAAQLAKEAAKEAKRKAKEAEKEAKRKAKEAKRSEK